MCHHPSLHGVGRLLCLLLLFLVMVAGGAATDETTGTGAEPTGSLAKACDPSKLQRSAKHTFIILYCMHMVAMVH